VGLVTERGETEKRSKCWTICLKCVLEGKRDKSGSRCGGGHGSGGRISERFAKGGGRRMGEETTQPFFTISKNRVLGRGSREVQYPEVKKGRGDNYIKELNTGKNPDVTRSIREGGRVWPLGGQMEMAHLKDKEAKDWV